MINLADHAMARVFVGVVDCALGGSEYALEAWKILRRHTLNSHQIPLDEFNLIVDLLDRAKDDVEGVQLRIDFSQDKVYEVNRPAVELGETDDRN